MADEQSKSNLPGVKEGETDDQKMSTEDNLDKVGLPPVSKDKSEESDQGTGTDEGFVSAPHTADAPSGPEGTSESACTLDDYGGSLSQEVESLSEPLLPVESITEKCKISPGKGEYTEPPVSTKKPEEKPAESPDKTLRHSSERFFPAKREAVQTASSSEAEYPVSDEFKESVTGGKKARPVVSKMFHKLGKKMSKVLHLGPKSEERQLIDVDSPTRTHEGGKKAVGTDYEATSIQDMTGDTQGLPLVLEDTEDEFKPRFSAQKGGFCNEELRMSFDSSISSFSATETSNVPDTSSSAVPRDVESKSASSKSSDTDAHRSRLSSTEEYKEAAEEESRLGRESKLLAASEGQSSSPSKRQLRRQKRVKERNESSESDDESASNVCLSPRKKASLQKPVTEDESEQSKSKDK